MLCSIQIVYFSCLLGLTSFCVINAAEDKHWSLFLSLFILQLALFDSKVSSQEALLSSTLACLLMLLMSR